MLKRMFKFFLLLLFVGLMLVSGSVLFSVGYVIGEENGCNGALLIHPNLEELNLYCEPSGSKMVIKSMYSKDFKFPIPRK